MFLNGRAPLARPYYPGEGDIRGSSWERTALNWVKARRGKGVPYVETGPKKYCENRESHSSFFLLLHSSRPKYMGRGTWKTRTIHSRVHVRGQSGRGVHKAAVSFAPWIRGRRRFEMRTRSRVRSPRARSGLPTPICDISEVVTLLSYFSFLSNLGLPGRWQKLS